MLISELQRQKNRKTSTIQFPNKSFIFHYIPFLGIVPSKTFKGLIQSIQRAGQDRTGEYQQERTEHDRAGQDRSGYDWTGRGRICQDSTAQDI